MRSKYNKHVIVVGTARSGTSWLSETMAKQFRYRILFEPEHQTRTSKGYLICDRWIDSKTEAKYAHDYLHRIFKNRVDCDWIAQNSNRKLKMHLWPFIPKKFIIKFVRANLCAKYMNESFNIPVVHIIRNPYDVIKSQQNVRFPWLYDLSIFARQEQLVSLIYDQFNYDITQFTRLKDYEKLCLRWCIENVIPIQIFNGYQNRSVVVKYEDLVEDIQKFYDLCKTFEIEPLHNLESIYRKPSSKTHPESQLITNKEVSSPRMDKTNRKAINKLLDIFESNLYERF